MTTIKQWDDEKLAELKKLWKEGVSISRIGEALGCSRNAVAGKIHRLGLPKRQSPIKGFISGSGGKERRKKVLKTPDILDRKDIPLKLVLRKINWSHNKCSWPIGDPKSTKFKFCGDEVVSGKPYCNTHCFEAYTTTRENSGSS